MINLFSKKKKLISSNADVEVMDKPVKGKKTMDQIIDEIHETFFTEVDRLAKMAKIKKEFDANEIYIMKKGDRLRSIGFVECKKEKI